MSEYKTNTVACLNVQLQDINQICLCSSRVPTECKYASKVGALDEDPIYSCQRYEAIDGKIIDSTNSQEVIFTSLKRSSVKERGLRGKILSFAK